MSTTRIHLTAFPLRRPCVVSEPASRFSCQNRKDAAHAAQALCTAPSFRTDPFCFRSGVSPFHLSLWVYREEPSHGQEGPHLDSRSAVGCVSGSESNFHQRRPPAQADPRIQIQQ